MELQHFKLSALRTKFSASAQRGIEFARENAITMAGICGVISGSCIAAAEPNNNVALFLAGVTDVTSYATMALWGNRDRSETNDTVAGSFQLTRRLKSFIPWKNPVSSFTAQQFVCGVCCVFAAINPHAASLVTSVDSWGLLFEGLFCITAPFQSSRKSLALSLAMASMPIGVAAFEIKRLCLYAAFATTLASDGFVCLSEKRPHPMPSRDQDRGHTCYSWLTAQLVR